MTIPQQTEMRHRSAKGTHDILAIQVNGIPVSVQIKISEVVMALLTPECKFTAIVIVPASISVGSQTEFCNDAIMSTINILPIKIDHITITVVCLRVVYDTILTRVLD